MIIFSLVFLTSSAPLKIGKCAPWCTCTPGWEPLFKSVSNLHVASDFFRGCCDIHPTLYLKMYPTLWVWAPPAATSWRRPCLYSLLVCIVINNSSYPTVKNNNTAYYTFGKYWMQSRGFLNYRLKYCWPKVIYCICLGLSDGQYFTGLAGILLLISQRPIKGRYFENQCLKPVLWKYNNLP